MAKQYLDLAGLATYDGLIKARISSGLSEKSDTTHNHDDKYDKKGASSTALSEAKAYTDTVKNGLLNGAGQAYDTLLELGNLIDDNTDAIEALETVATNKADKTHKHTVADITDLTVDATELNYMDGTTSNVQAQLDSKLSLSGGTMTGEITLAQNTLAKRDIDTSGVIIHGGTEFSNSASVAVYGKDQANYSGRFRLTADNGEETCTLEGRPNGVLKWDGQNVLTNDDKTEIQTQLDNKVSEADQKWNLLYDSGEISAIANSISNIDVSGYNNIQVLVRVYNDGDSVNSRNGSAIFTCKNGKTYQFPVWSNMFSKSINTVYVMGTFKLVDGWLVCPCASRLIGDADTFDVEGGTAGNLTPTGSGIMKCTSSLSTLTISNLDQNSNYYFGMGSRVMVWGWK